MLGSVVIQVDNCAVSSPKPCSQDLCSMCSYVMERGLGCCAGSVLLLKYYLLLHESRMISEWMLWLKYKSREVVMKM